MEFNIYTLPLLRLKCCWWSLTVLNPCQFKASLIEVICFRWKLNEENLKKN